MEEGKSLGTTALTSSTNVLTLFKIKARNSGPGWGSYVGCLFHFFLLSFPLLSLPLYSSFPSPTSLLLPSPPLLPCHVLSSPLLSSPLLSLSLPSPFRQQFGLSLTSLCR